MSKTIAVKLEKEELSYLIDYLLGDLRVWSEKGFESRGEEESFQHIISVVNKLREANGENAVIFV